MDRLDVVAQMDAIRHEERTSPKWRLERLIAAEAKSRQLSEFFHAAVIVQGRLASPKLKAANLAQRDHYRAAANCIGRYIRREIKRGVL